ncbi:MFS transporter [Paenibacillus bouchesdurhonensis]|uniref:MFS transporter n=1 Tax=Paenibacillus bouchesdurhonensis TaxID=1870990 RepID=UPI000DA635CF|nr:MFS transporter [Paenibacillus bouchesdurhonensis]
MKKSFYYLWGSQTLSNIADLLYTLALTMMILKESGSIIVTTLIPFFVVISRLISGLFAPLMIERFRLPSLILLSQMSQFFIFILLYIYVTASKENLNIFIILAFVFTLAFLDGWTMPSRNALIPRLVDNNALLKANGIISITDQVVQFGGWALGGIMLIIIGPHYMLAIISLCYGITAFITLFIDDPTEPPRRHLWDLRVNRKEQRELTDSHWKEMKEGWVALWKSARLRSLLFMDATEQFGGAVWAGPFILMFVLEVLDKNEQWWGYINASYFAGAVIGGLILISLVKQIEKRIVLCMLGGTLGYVIVTVLYAVNSNAFLTLFIVLFTGPLTELANICRRTIMQRSVDNSVLPKVFSAQYVVLSLIYGLSLLMMSILADSFGIATVYIIAAAISGLAVIVGWMNRKSFTQTNQPEQNAASVK